MRESGRDDANVDSQELSARNFLLNPVLYGLSDCVCRLNSISYLFHVVPVWCWNADCHRPLAFSYCLQQSIYK